jgi:hypothetical protein
MPNHLCGIVIINVADSSCRDAMNRVSIKNNNVEMINCIKPNGLCNGFADSCRGAMNHLGDAMNRVSTKTTKKLTGIIGNRILMLQGGELPIIRC